MRKLFSALKKPAKPATTLLYQHRYDGGYEHYRNVQVAANKKKLDKVWAEEITLNIIAEYIESTPQRERRGLCHGARNGWEVKWLGQRLHCEVIGTDISETAKDMENMVQHDFHEPREAWVSRFSFIYTNSLDQAFNPERALSVWAEQLADGGLIFIEHTMFHSASGASEMDPFGAHPMVMPYLFFEWGRGKYQLEDILKLKDVPMSERGVFKSKGDVWVFILQKWSRMGKGE